MSIGDWAALATAEALAAAAWVSATAFVVFGVLVFCRLVIRWRVSWFWIALVAGAAVAARILTEGRIWWLPTTPPLPLG